MQTNYRPAGHIPFRFILAILISAIEVVLIIGLVLAACNYIPYFYLLAWATEIFCVVRIIASDDNPDYKVPWLVFVLVVPVIGFMLYFLFYSRKLRPKIIRRLKSLENCTYQKEDSELLEGLTEIDVAAAGTAWMLCHTGNTHLFVNTKADYFPTGRALWESMLKDLRKAQSFIYLSYFIIEEGVCWDTILEILKEKAAAGLDVRVLYDDIGCMTTLPGNYAKQLRKLGIRAYPFSRLRGNADSEFNNRSHRKITVIDGQVGYTGGANLADEYIGERIRFGEWKDVGLRLEGDAVWEMTRLFLVDYGITAKPIYDTKTPLYPAPTCSAPDGYIIPFGDGPRPIYPKRVTKNLIIRMLSSATRYVYIATPYLIIDNEVCSALENAAMRGVDVRIVVPHIPDKKFVFLMTRSFYRRLTDGGIKIYEYTPGFIHAKCYLADGESALVGTTNLDYRSLVHHFENSVWMYRTSCIRDIEADLLAVMERSAPVEKQTDERTLRERILSSLIRIFAPLM